MVGRWHFLSGNMLIFGLVNPLFLFLGHTWILGKFTIRRWFAFRPRCAKGLLKGVLRVALVVTCLGVSVKCFSMVLPRLGKDNKKKHHFLTKNVESWLQGLFNCLATRIITRLRSNHWCSSCWWHELRTNSWFPLALQF